MDGGGKEQVDKVITGFVQSRGRRIIDPILVISYETFRSHSSLLQNAEDIGLVLCDEVPIIYILYIFLTTYLN